MNTFFLITSVLAFAAIGITKKKVSSEKDELSEKPDRSYEIGSMHWDEYGNPNVFTEYDKKKSKMQAGR